MEKVEWADSEVCPLGADPKPFAQKPYTLSKRQKQERKNKYAAFGACA